MTNVVDMCGATGGTWASCNALTDVGIFLAGCLIGYLAGRCAKSAGKGQMNLYDRIVREILEFQKISNEDAESILPIIKSEMKSGCAFSDPRMRSIFRIECVYTKTVGSNYGAEVIVYRQGTDRRGKIVRINLTFDWSWLPSEVRKSFMLKRSERITILMYDRKD